MENTLAKYMNRNLKDSVVDLQVVQGTAKDSGNIYYCLELAFVNGYKTRIFARGGDAFALANAFDVLDVSTHMVMDED